MLAMLKGEHNAFCGSVNTGAWYFSQTEGGVQNVPTLKGWSKKFYPVLKVGGGGEAKSLYGRTCGVPLGAPVVP